MGKEANVAASEKAKEKNQITPEAAIVGVLALLVNEREERLRENKGGAKTELLLSNAGLSIEQIAGLVDKSYDSVKKTLQRGRK